MLERGIWGKEGKSSEYKQDRDREIQHKNGLYSSYGSRVCDSTARGGDGIETERDSKGFVFQSDACSTFLFLCSFLDRIHSQRIVSSIEGTIQDFKPGIRIIIISDRKNSS